MRSMRISHVINSAMFACIVVSCALQAASLTVEVSGIQQADGIVRIGLYDTAKGFPDEHQFTLGQTIAASKAINGSVSVSFNNLTPGEYAVAGYQDVNTNDEMDTNMVGIPTEPYGASLGARNLLSPPEYDDAKFKLEDETRVIKVKFE